MRLFQRLFGGSQASPATWKTTLTSLGESALVLENTLKTFSVGQAALIVAPGEPPGLDDFIKSLQVKLGKRYSVTGDDQNHAWVIAKSSGLTNLTQSLQFSIDKLTQAGLESRILAAVFPFKWTDRTIYWICRGRTLKFTPFALDGRGDSQLRDFTLEQRMEKASRKLFPTDRNVQNWFPLWGMPI